MVLLGSGISYCLLYSFLRKFANINKNVFHLWMSVQTYFLPVIGLVDVDKLKPGDLVGVNKDSYLILETLPAEYDARVKAMEVDERPTEQYSDIGGLDKQIQEVTCVIILIFIV